MSRGNKPRSGVNVNEYWVRKGKAGAGLHREGMDSFHLKKRMKLAFTGALLLLAAAKATRQQQVSLPRGCLLVWQPDFMK